MVKPSQTLLGTGLFIHNVCFKLQILARIVAQSSLLVWQREPVNKCISGQLLLPYQRDFYWLVQFRNVPVLLRVYNLVRVSS